MNPLRLVKVLSLCLVMATMSSPVLSGGHTGSAPPNYAPYFPYVHRTNIVVADMDRALSLYRDILDFEVAFVVPVTPGGILHETFELDPDVKARIAFLDSGKGQFGDEAKSIVGLSEVPGYEPPQQDIYNHTFIIEVTREIQDLYEEISAAGLKTGPIMELSNPTRTELPFTDFDGHRIIIMKLHD